MRSGPFRSRFRPPGCLRGGRYDLSVGSDPLETSVHDAGWFVGDDAVCDGCLDAYLDDFDDTDLFESEPESLEELKDMLVDAERLLPVEDVDVSTDVLPLVCVLCSEEFFDLTDL